MVCTILTSSLRNIIVSRLHASLLSHLNSSWIVHEFAGSRPPHPKAVLQESKVLKKKTRGTHGVADKGVNLAFGGSRAVDTAALTAQQVSSLTSAPMMTQALPDTSAPNYRSLFERLRSVPLRDEPDPGASKAAIQPDPAATKPEVERSHQPPANSIEFLPSHVVDKVRRRSSR